MPSHLLQLEWKEKDLKAKSGRTEHRLDRDHSISSFFLACSPESFLSPSHSPKPLGFHAPLDSPTSASHLASPLRTGSASYLRARPAAMLALVAARQRTQAAEAVGNSAVQCRAQRQRGGSSAALYCCCACTATLLLLLYLSPSCASRCTSSAGRCSAVQTVRGEWR